MHLHWLLFITLQPGYRLGKKKSISIRFQKLYADFQFLSEKILIFPYLYGKRQRPSCKTNSLTNYISPTACSVKVLKKIRGRQSGGNVGHMRWPELVVTSDTDDLQPGDY